MRNTNMIRFAHRLLAGVLVVSAALIGASAEAQEGAPAPTDLTVTEVQLATAVENGQAVSPTTTFARSDGRIFAVIRLANPSSEATSIRVSIEPADGPARQGVSLEVRPQPRYRTVARMSAAQRPGRYRVVVRTEDGRELSSTEVTINE